MNAAISTKTTHGVTGIGIMPTMAGASAGGGSLAMAGTRTDVA